MQYKQPFKTEDTYQLLQTNNHHELNNNRYERKARSCCKTYFCERNKENINKTNIVSKVHQISFRSLAKVDIQTVRQADRCLKGREKEN